MSVDPMATAIDWLDAYRARDLDTLMSLFGDEAILECTWCVSETIVGKEPLRAFWPERFSDCGASIEVHDIMPEHDGASISYVARNELMMATLKLAPDGKIAFMRWGRPCAPSEKSFDTPVNDEFPFLVLQRINGMYRNLLEPFASFAEALSKVESVPPGDYAILHLGEIIWPRTARA
ncbi:nuclear transport factor 2 family protein [Bradyrhizobium sp. UFLA03-84]|uniref:nuclear transport factor 2 family protein n=1 Tax=Bradyrhizobium sp. UFLA03-84 TaxID=418599 RepID=UPI001177FBC8|nr:nuclear transport factor 2 family protein [Bradyrhizobium sp. UFLA03-84]